MEYETKKRYAIVVGGISHHDISLVRDYLPANYKAQEGTASDPRIRIQGTDNHGWTLDGYVIPRLASGLIAAVEVSGEEE